MIRRCAGSSAATRRTGARPRRARWAALRRNGSRRPRTSLLLPTCLASGSTLCMAEGRRVALCSTWIRAAAEGHRQGRMASGRTLSPRRLHRDEHEPPGRARRCFLQQARDVRAMDQGGKGAIKWTRLSCRTFAANAVRLQLHALAYNLGNFLRTLATPEPIKDWSLTTLKDKLIKIGAKVVSHGRYVIFQMAEVAIARQMFQEILRLIAELRPQPPPAPA